MVDTILEIAEEGEGGPEAGAAGTGGLRGPAVMSLVLEPWLDELLVALKTIVAAAWEGQGGSDKQAPVQVGAAPGRQGAGVSEAAAAVEGWRARARAVAAWLQHPAGLAVHHSHAGCSCRQGKGGVPAHVHSMPRSASPF